MFVLHLFCYYLFIFPMIFQLTNGAENDLIVIVWGLPKDPSGCSTSNNLTMDACVANCYSDEKCMLTYQSGNDCIICGYQQVSQVEKSDAISGTRVGFKIQYQLNSNQCVVDGNPPTFNNSAAKGLVSTDAFSDRVFQINFNSATNTWAFTYPKCPNNWKEVDRPKGAWCMQISYIASGKNQSDAEAYCGRYVGGVLSGLETINETNWAVVQALALNNGVDGEMYVDGVKSATCNVPNWRNIPECNTIDGFSFADPYLSTKSGYNLRPTGFSCEPGCSCSFILFAHTVRESGITVDYCGDVRMSLILCGKPAVL